jgi:hypothetical protein
MTSLPVYFFRDAAVGQGRGDVVCLAEGQAVRAVISTEQAEKLFGGFAVYAAQGGDFVGAWGERNAAEFRSLLQAGGLELILRHSRPPGMRVSRTTISGRGGA